MLQALKNQFDRSASAIGKLLNKPIRVDDKGNVKLGDSDRAKRKDERRERHDRLRQMRQDLFTLFGQHASSRRLMRNLAMVERALQAEGLSGMEALPVRNIARALSELEKLVSNWSPSGLAELRSRMAVIVKDHVRAATAPPAAANADKSQPMPPPPESDFLAPTRVDISEATHAEFEEMERSWIGVIPKPMKTPTETAEA